MICFDQGFVISDWQGIDRITSPPNKNYTYSVLASVSAGIDMVNELQQLAPLSFFFQSILKINQFIIYMITSSEVLDFFQIMIPYNYTDFIKDLTFLVKYNFIPMSRIDDAVSRILRVKFSMGLFEKPYADRSLVDQLGSQVNPFENFTSPCLLHF